ncbi:MAG TPA: efflux RND transporter periplasmic adaptor subunit, partial [Minicystis sp.]|nr:efflux RND transporter periplasmic adaptor subunit [Minicystis sp.]
MPPLPEEPRRDPARDEHDPHAQGELGFDLPPPAQISPRRAAVIAGVALAALVTALAAGLVPRWRASRALAAETQAASTDRPRVEVVAPKVASSERALELPGSVQPLEETIVYPRASGYVRKW